jgi:hypothetical protein
LIARLLCHNCCHFFSFSCTAMAPCEDY